MSLLQNIVKYIGRPIILSILLTKATPQCALSLFRNNSSHAIIILAQYRLIIIPAHYRIILAHYRIILAHYRIILAHYRIILAHYRANASPRVNYPPDNL